MRRLNHYLPKYTILPLVITVFINFFTYNGSRLLRPDVPLHCWKLPADDLIPLIPAFLIIYVLAYLQWIFGYIIIARESPDLCRRYLSGEIIAKLICLVFFLFLPTTMTRPEIAGTGFFDRCLSFVYKVDPADNLFPSLHCLASWFCFRGALKAKKMPKWYAPVSFIFTLGVFSSTVLVKQHLLLDIVGGIAVCELGLLLSRLLRADRFYSWLEQKLFHIHTDKEEPR